MPALKDFGLNPTILLRAVSHPARWKAMQMMADGTRIAATHLAPEVGRNEDTASKHLRALRDAGAVECCVGEDARWTFFFIPDRFRSQPGIIDYGFCTLRLDTKK